MLSLLFAIVAVILFVLGMHALRSYRLRPMGEEAPAAPDETSDVAAPLKPRRPVLSGAVAVEEPEEEQMVEALAKERTRTRPAALRKAIP